MLKQEALEQAQKHANITHERMYVARYHMYTDRDDQWTFTSGKFGLSTYGHPIIPIDPQPAPAQELSES